MPLDFEEDLSPFFNEDEFAVPATVGGVALSVIFDDGYAEDEDIEGTNPQIICKSADLPVNLAHGATVVTGGKTYSVASIQPDETQTVTVIELEHISG